MLEGAMNEAEIHDGVMTETEAESGRNKLTIGVKSSTCYLFIIETCTFIRLGWYPTVEPEHTSKWRGRFTRLPSNSD